MDEVERVAAAYPDIAAVAVVGIPDPRDGEVGVAFVIPRDGAEFSPDAFLAFLGNLPRSSRSCVVPIPR